MLMSPRDWKGKLKCLLKQRTFTEDNVMFKVPQQLKEGCISELRFGRKKNSTSNLHIIFRC